MSRAGYLLLLTRFVLLCRAATACLRKKKKKRHEIRNMDGAFKLLSTSWGAKRRRVDVNRMTRADMKLAEKESKKFVRMSKIVYVGRTPRQG